MNNRRAFTLGTLFCTSTLAYLVLSTITRDSASMEEWGKVIGVGVSAFAGVLDSLKNFVPDIMKNWLAKAGDEYYFHKNHDLENAWKLAYEKTFEEIKDDVFIEYKLGNPSLIGVAALVKTDLDEREYLRQQLSNCFFTALENYFIKDDVLEKVIEKNSQLDFSSYIETALTDNESLLFPETSVITKEKLLEMVRKGMKDYLPRNFVQSIKVNEKAKTAYFKILLELNVRELAEARKDIATLNTQMQTLQSLASQTNNDLAKILQEASLNDKQLANHLKALKNIRKDVAEVLRRSKYWVPNLSVYHGHNIRKGIGNNTLNYRSQYTSFIGRQSEWAQLNDFVDNDEQFLWWQLTGQGGMGKSRLALEFCKYLLSKRGFYAGFYNVEAQLPNDDRLIEDKIGFFIIIDYAMSDIDKVIEFIGFLYDKMQTALSLNDTKKFKIRILFLDRSSRQEFIQQIKPYPCFKTDFYPLQLQKEGEDLRWEIIEQVVQKETKANNWTFAEDLLKKKTEVISELTKLDPLKRPLFAFFAAEAMVYSPDRDIKRWDIDYLLENHIDRLKTRVWKMIEKNPDYIYYNDFITLLSTNTLIRYIPENDLEYVVKVELSPFLSYAQDNRLLQAYIKRNEFTIILGQRFYSGLQPDIVGEFFFLKMIKEWISKGKADAVTQLLNIAWHILPDQTWKMLALLHEDFFQTSQPEDLALERILFLQVNGAFEHARIAKYKSNLFVSLPGINRGGFVTRQLDEYLPFYQEIYNRHKNDLTIKLQFVNLSLMVSIECSKLRYKLETCKTYLENAHQLIQPYENSTDDLLRKLVAESYFNIATFYYAFLPDHIAAEKLYVKGIEIIEVWFSAEPLRWGAMKARILDYYYLLLSGKKELKKEAIKCLLKLITLLPYLALSQEWWASNVLAGVSHKIIDEFTGKHNNQKGFILIAKCGLDALEASLELDYHKANVYTLSYLITFAYRHINNADKMGDFLMRHNKLAQQLLDENLEFYELTMARNRYFMGNFLITVQEIPDAKNVLEAAFIYFIKQDSSDDLTREFQLNIMLLLRPIYRQQNAVYDLSAICSKILQLLINYNNTELEAKTLNYICEAYFDLAYSYSLIDKKQRTLDELHRGFYWLRLLEVLEDSNDETIKNFYHYGSAIMMKLELDPKTYYDDQIEPGYSKFIRALQDNIAAEKDGRDVTVDLLNI